jgi:hypothetical protein
LLALDINFKVQKYDFNNQKSIPQGMFFVNGHPTDYIFSELYDTSPAIKIGLGKLKPRKLF